VKEHLSASSAQASAALQIGSIKDLETVERIVRQGQYMGPYVLNWVAIGGGHDGPNPRNLMEFINRVPQNAVLTVEGLMRHVYPLNAMGIAMGLHVRVGQEDNLWGRRGERATSVQQIEKMVKISRSARPIATGERRTALGDRTFYSSVDETFEKNGWLPNRKPAAAAQREARDKVSSRSTFPYAWIVFALTFGADFGLHGSAGAERCLPVTEVRLASVGRTTRALSGVVPLRSAS
jgi:hypothetical protein